jgi:hypothetical protein
MLGLFSRSCWANTAADNKIRTTIVSNFFIVVCIM